MHLQIPKQPFFYILRSSLRLVLVSIHLRWMASNCCRLLFHLKLGLVRSWSQHARDLLSKELCLKHGLRNTNEGKEHLGFLMPKFHLKKRIIFLGFAIGNKDFYRLTSWDLHILTFEPFKMEEKWSCHQIRSFELLVF